MYQSTELPDIQLLPIEALIPHEDCDPRRVEKLSKRLLEEGLLKNPPVIAEIPGSDQYVVLDGANRVTTFQTLGVPHIVAQLVSYDSPGVLLDTWYHVVSGMQQHDFERGLLDIPNMRIEKSTLIEARKNIATGLARPYVVGNGSIEIIIPDTEADGDKQIKMLNHIVDVYRGKADIFRASNDVWEIQKPYYPDIIALVVFPRLHPEDIIEAARNAERIPSGITRHIIQARAININIPIGILMADWSFKRKKEWMDQWMMERMSVNAIRYYAESTFSFNE